MFSINIFGNVYIFRETPGDQWFVRKMVSGTLWESSRGATPVQRPTSQGFTRGYSLI